MEKVFILYNCDGKTLCITQTLKGMITYAREQIDLLEKNRVLEHENSDTVHCTDFYEGDIPSLTINQYEVGSEAYDSLLTEVLEAFEIGEEPENLYTI